MKKGLLPLVLLLSAALPAQTQNFDIEDASSVTVGQGFQGTQLTRFDWTSDKVPTSEFARCVLLLGFEPQGPFINTAIHTEWQHASRVRFMIRPQPVWGWVLDTRGVAKLPPGASFWIQPIWLDNVQVGWDRPVKVSVR